MVWDVGCESGVEKDVGVKGRRGKVFSHEYIFRGGSQEKKRELKFQEEKKRDCYVNN